MWERGSIVDFLSIRATDILDVFLVYFLTYKLFLLIKGTRAIPMVVGLLLIVLVSLLAELLKLDALRYIVGHARTVFLIAFVILFQPELRRVLTRMGENRILARYLDIGSPGVLDEVAAAARRFATEGTGALMVLERDIGFKSIVESGIPMSARVSVDLLATIFVPNSPLHDGAVIIRGNQIVAAACILPLTQNAMIDRSLGTRHRAAIGVSEETDAVVIVVSEESRRISVAFRGTLDAGLSPEQLRQRLADYFESSWRSREAAVS